MPVPRRSGAGFSLQPSAFSLARPGQPYAAARRARPNDDHAFANGTAHPNFVRALTIVQPGSYYLTTNLSVTAANAITIVANNVTLDLNGFTISSTAPGATGYGIELGNVNATTNISIFNGFISSGVTNNAGTYGGSGFAYGIAYPGAVQPRNVRVRNVSVTGCLDNGIYLPLGGSTVVESCTVSVVGFTAFKPTASPTRRPSPVATPEWWPIPRPIAPAMASAMASWLLHPQ